MIADPAARRHAVVRRLLHWYGENARDLPWRRPEATPWQVMVSEFMLQQTPVERVRGPWQTWVERWPSPAALADAPPGEAVRAWGRLGYPRRALRLHAAAVAITERFGGEVPADRESLLSLPGVGSYTAAAIASFAYGRRELVLDTNVRRVLTRIDAGLAQPGPSPTVAELAAAAGYVPTGPRGRPAGRSRRWSWAPWSAWPGRRAAPTVPSATSARGGPPATPRTTGRPAAARPGTAPTGSAGALCSLCSAVATNRCPSTSWPTPGPTRSSANAVCRAC
ncbi:A/G-specific adenine glycosylase [uncultured Friedmanniella sp.]|uniref:A/G-specific adenine glycosylase n=1 Tax=uncultured Friedmanniella sp. TaxID=335381 RepID=UPI0035CB02C8